MARERTGEGGVAVGEQTWLGARMRSKMGSSAVGLPNVHLVTARTLSFHVWLQSSSQYNSAMASRKHAGSE